MNQLDSGEFEFCESGEWHLTLVSMIISRFGVMFFDDPVRAFAN